MAGNVARHHQRCARSRDFIKPTDNIGTKTLPDYEAYATQHIYNVALPGCAHRPGVRRPAQGPFTVTLGEVFDLINLEPARRGFNAAEPSDLDDKNVTIAHAGSADRLPCRQRTR